MIESMAIQKLDQARTALALCRTLPEVKRLRNMAEAAKIYARSAHLGREAQNYAAEISLLASRKAGEILKQLERDTPKQAGAKKGAASVAGASAYRQTLVDTKTPERTAQYWQRLSQIPDDVVHEYLASSIKEEREITTTGLLAHVTQPKTKKEKQTMAVRLVRLAGRVIALNVALKAVVSLKEQWFSDCPKELADLAVACRSIDFQKIAKDLSKEI